MQHGYVESLRILWFERIKRRTLVATYGAKRTGVDHENLRSVGCGSGFVTSEGRDHQGFQIGALQA